jgi:hypothetical protein
MTSRPRPPDTTAASPEISHVKDGKVTERWAFSDDTQAIADSSPEDRAPAALQTADGPASSAIRTAR